MSEITYDEWNRLTTVVAASATGDHVGGLAFGVGNGLGGCEQAKGDEEEEDGKEASGEHCGD